MFNLADLKSALTFNYELELPDGTPTGVIFTLAGNGHPATKAAVRAFHDKDEKRKRPATSTQREQDGLEITRARVLGWQGLTEGGVEIPFSAAKLEEMLSDPTLDWVLKRLLTALGDDALFFKP